MSRVRRTTWWRAALAGLAGAGVLAVLQPWTIRPIATVSPAAFEPASFVDRIWPARVISEARSSASDVHALPRVTIPSDNGSLARPRTMFVKGTGVVVRVDRASRVGVARVAFTGATPAVEADVQIGPVIRGTTLRDTLPFISFSDFTNQLDFASVASELNGRVLRDVLSALDADALQGRTVSVVGAGTFSGGRLVDIVPVVFDVTRGAP